MQTQPIPQRPQRASADEVIHGPKAPAFFILDNIRSGLNVGSIFRTADAFSFNALLLCGITAQPPHREILKTALGSTESVHWAYFHNTADAIADLKASGVLILGVEQAANPLWVQDMPVAAQQKNAVAFVLGNEVDGISPEIAALCDHLMEIPQYGAKHSLNVAVAAGIVAWEFTRRYRGL